MSWKILGSLLLCLAGVPQLVLAQATQFELRISQAPGSRFTAGCLVVVDNSEAGSLSLDETAPRRHRFEGQSVAVECVNGTAGGPLALELYHGDRRVAQAMTRSPAGRVTVQTGGDGHFYADRLSAESFDSYRGYLRSGPGQTD